MTVKLPLINEQASFVTGNCFRFYAFEERKDKDGNAEERENAVASAYFMKGLKELHESYFAGANFELVERGEKAKRAFAYFHLALAAKPNYFCAREALRFTAERNLFDDVAESETYALEKSNNPHPEKPCHLLHPGFFSASELSKLEESVRK